MHNPVTHTDEPVLAEPLAEERDEIVECAGVSQRDTLTPRLFIQSRASSILSNKLGTCVQPLGLAARSECDALRAFGEQRELEARRARVQYGDCVGHDGPSRRWPCW